MPGMRRGDPANCGSRKGLVMQDLLTAGIFAIVLATSPHPVMFLLTFAIIMAALYARLWFIWHLPHRRGGKYR